MALTFLGFSHLRQWRDDDYDYDVLWRGPRPHLLPGCSRAAGPRVDVGERAQRGQRAAHGYEPTREAAVAAFAKSCMGVKRRSP
jgi:hypothetical protein